MCVVAFHQFQKYQHQQLFASKNFVITGSVYITSNHVMLLSKATQECTLSNRFWKFIGVCTTKSATISVQAPNGSTYYYLCISQALQIHPSKWIWQKNIYIYGWTANEMRHR